MKTTVLRRSALPLAGRLDAKYFLSAGVLARARVQSAQKAGLELAQLGGEEGLARCWHPDRFRRSYAVEGEDKVPYLRPYDVFNYVPMAADWLSKKRTEKLSTYILRPDMLLQTASGRNLGPAAAADSYIARFVLGDDMIRVEIHDELVRYFVLSFLLSPTGQSLMQSDKTGSVIDHMSPEQLGEQQVPRFDEATERRIGSKMREAVKIRERSRLTIAKEFELYEGALPPIRRENPHKSGWTVYAKDLTGRIDAAPYDPALSRIRRTLKSIGGVALSAAADVSKPSGRYKTVYVGKQYGTPILSGGQVLQATPIKLQYMARGAIEDPEKYRLRTGTVVFQADGRSEEGLGIPAVVTPDRDGWMASGHVGRLSSPSDFGWVYLATRSSHVQAQLRALACGSVVDALYEDDIRRVILPPALDCDTEKVEMAWRDFAVAQAAEDEAIFAFEEALTAAIRG